MEPVRCRAVRAPLCPAYGWVRGTQRGRAVGADLAGVGWLVCEPKCPGVDALYLLLGQLAARRPAPAPEDSPEDQPHRLHNFREEASLNLLWNPDAIEDNVPLVQQNLIRHARLLAVTGVAFSDSDEASAMPQSSALACRSVRELQSRYIPSVPAGPSKSCHKYRQLGSGTFGEALGNNVAADGLELRRRKTPGSAMGSYWSTRTEAVLPRLDFMPEDDLLIERKD